LLFLYGKEKKLKKLSLLVLIAVLTIGAISCSKREELVVAQINDKVITVKDFENAAKIVDEKYLPETNDLEGKKQLLERIIDKEVMAMKAKAAGYEKEEWFQDFWGRFKNPFLVAAMLDELVRKKVDVSEEEVKDYYDKMHYEYTLSQIVVPNEDDAIEIRNRILQGADFAEMAKKYSLGAAAEDGGYIGSNAIGDMHWWVEEALFKMKEGDVSEPLRTSSGYALIKVHRIRKILPEHDMDYARKRVRAIKEKKGIEALKAKIEKEIHLRFFPDAIDVAYNSLPPDIPFKDIISYKVTRENAPKLQIPDKYRDMILAQYDDGMVTLEDFKKLYESLALPERPRRQYGKGSIVQTVHKSIFDKVLPVYAEQKAHILDIPEVKEKLEKRKEQFLVYKFYQDQVKEQVGVTEREMEDYYNKHLEELAEPEKREFLIILLKDLDTAKQVANKAKQGMKFSLLVKEFSQDPKAKETLGRTGLVTKGKYPEYDDVAFSLPEGGISDPIKTSRGWAVIKVEKVEKGKIPTIGDVASKIKKAILEEKAEKLLEEKLKRWRESYDIKIFEDNLKKAKLQRVKVVTG